MRYALVEFFFRDGKPVFNWVGTDMSLTSAADAKRAWGYQASFKGGWMEIIEDTQEAFDKWRDDLLQNHPRLKKATGAA